MTLTQIEQKYFPGLGGPQAYRDTIVKPHVDGDAYFEAIANAIDACDGPNDRIYIVSWLFVPTLRLRDDATAPLLKDLLLQKADRGVDTRVIVATPRLSIGTGIPPLSREFFLMLASTLSPIADIAKASARSALALRDASFTGSKPLAKRVIMDWGGAMDTRHQKFTVVYRAATQDLRAFVGGLDFTPTAVADEFHSTPAAFWHDAGVELRGGAAYAVLEEFRTRWEEVETLPTARYMLDGKIAEYNPGADPTPSALPAPPLVLTPPPVPAGGGYTNTSVRMLRSYEQVKGLFKLAELPWNTLPATGVQEIFESLKTAINAAQSYIYIEDQSLNPVNIVERKIQEHKMLFPLIADRCRRGVKVVFVTQGRAAPNVPIAASLTMSPEVSELILSGLSLAERENFAFFAVYQTKVHSKIVLVDDEFASIGSANLWDRSMTGEESELNAAIMHEGGESSLIADLRVRLWCGHLRVSTTAQVVSELRSQTTGFNIFRAGWGTPVTFDRPDSALIEITP